MSLARKIAAGLRELARRIDPPARQLTREEIETRIAASLAIPRPINRFVSKRTFSTRMPDGSPMAEALPVVRVAAEFEERVPGLYTGNDEMVAAIGRYRAGTFVTPDIAAMSPRPAIVEVPELPVGAPIFGRLLAALKGHYRPEADQ